MSTIIRSLRIGLALCLFSGLALATSQTSSAADISISPGCEALQDPALDGYYDGVGLRSAEFYAGESISLRASSPMSAGGVVQVGAAFAGKNGYWPLDGTVDGAPMVFEVPDDDAIVHWWGVVGNARATWEIDCTVPTSADSDDDGVPDDADRCPGFDDRIDIDTDGIPDGCDELIDSDGDDVADDVDACGDTVLPDEPLRGVRKNRYAASREGFASINGVVVNSLADAAGCSAGQIIEELGLGRGHVKFGISRGVLRRWVAGTGS